MVKEAYDTIAKIDERTSLPLKTVTAIVVATFILAGSYADIRHKQENILEKLDTLERQLSAENSWSQADMERYIREAQLMNPDIKFPVVGDLSHKD